MRPLSLVSGLGRWLLFFDAMSRRVKRGLFLSLSRPRAQRAALIAATV